MGKRQRRMWFAALVAVLASAGAAPLAFAASDAASDREWSPLAQAVLDAGHPRDVVERVERGANASMYLHRVSQILKSEPGFGVIGIDDPSQVSAWFRHSDLSGDTWQELRGIQGAAKDAGVDVVFHDTLYGEFEIADQIVNVRVVALEKWGYNITSSSWSPFDNAVKIAGPKLGESEEIRANLSELVGELVAPGVPVDVTSEDAPEPITLYDQRRDDERSSRGASG